MGISSEKYVSERAWALNNKEENLALDTLTPALSQRREGERPAMLAIREARWAGVECRQGSEGALAQSGYRRLFCAIFPILKLTAPP